MLLPDKPQVAFLLERYRAWERLMLANPSNGTVRGRFEDTAYTLCVLMGRRSARRRHSPPSTTSERASPPVRSPIRSGSVRLSASASTGEVRPISASSGRVFSSAGRTADRC